MKIYIFIIILLSTFVVNAQKSNQDIKNKIGIGGIAGINFSKFSYSSDNYNYDNSTFLNSQFGLATEFYFSEKLSIRPSLLYAGRGMLIKQDEVNYMLSSKNIDWSVPVIYTFAPDNTVNPYIYIAPMLETTFGGKLGYGNVSTELSKANHSSTGLSLTPAMGLKFNLSEKTYLSFEAGYHIGLSNTFSKDELAGSADALNVSNYSIEGKRKNRALVFMASLIIKINKKNKKENKPVEEDVVIKEDKQIKKVVPEKDTVEVVADTTAKVVENKVDYTVKEIEKDIKEGIDVTNRKITFNNIEFELNKTKLTQNSKNYLNEIIEFLKNNKKIKTQINGHTDNTGTNEVNMKLSIGRAKSVYDYLISTGIEKSRLSYKGYGDTLPIETNDTKTGRAKNRRVEFKIISNK